MRVQFSPHESATQKVFFATSHTDFISMSDPYFDLELKCTEKNIICCKYEVLQLRCGQTNIVR